MASSSARPESATPRPQSAEASSSALEDPRVPLRLTVTRGALGMELYEPIEVGPLTVEGLSLTFSGLRFPVDLSGGVPRFRSRRGELQEVRLRLSLAALASFIADRVKEPLGALLRAPALWLIEGGLGVGLLGEQSALAFDLLWTPDGGHAGFVVSRARGVGLAAPALSVALRAVDCLVRGYGVRSGRHVEIRDLGGRIGRALLPAVGARAPASAELRLGELGAELDELFVALDATFPPPALSAPAARALDLARSTRAADDALAESRTEQARELLLLALEHAPRQREVVLTLCELDSVIPGRAEAALGLLVETLPAIAGGAVGARLLHAVGDAEGALLALRQAVAEEPFAPLAALLLVNAAQAAQSHERLTLLDRAVALSPALSRPRRERFQLRVERGDVNGALADAEHLEAMASGPSARHTACLEAALALAASGFAKQAGRAFERALRYVPDDVTATTGLGTALESAGQPTRAVALYERAVALAEHRGQEADVALMALAKILADGLGDAPQALAKLRRIQAGATQAEEARFLEGRYRARIGDLVGASLAFARFRELVELSNGRDGVAGLRLREAARFELASRSDVALAERHLALALRLSPHDLEIATEYRKAAELLDQRERARSGA